MRIRKLGEGATVPIHDEPIIHPYPTLEEIRQLIDVTRRQLARANQYCFLPTPGLVKAAIDALTTLQASLTPETDD
jgi:hypothetical protein